MYRGKKEEGGTEETETEKRRKTILQNRGRHHGIEINLITKKLGRERKEGKGSKTEVR
jgi:hypothetical protein